MTRVRMLGTCLLAGFAVGTTATSSASAAEYGQCRALTNATLPKAKHGKYADANCRTLDEKKGRAKGNFEWFPGAPANCVPAKHGEFTDAGCTSKVTKSKMAAATPRGSATFTTWNLLPCAPNCASNVSAGGMVTLSIAGIGAVTCANSTGAGEITGPTTSVETFTFNDCELNGAACQSGLAAGVIQTPQLEGHLTSPQPTEVFTYFENAAGVNAPYSFQFECPTVGDLFRIAGNVAGITTPVNVGIIRTEEEFRSGIGAQGLLTEVSSDAGTSWLGPFATLEETIIDNHYNAVIEIRT
jgi:hypothetical protein